MNSKFRPSAYPIITIDPYISIWADSDRPDTSYTKHWTGRNVPVFASVSVGRKQYILFARKNDGSSFVDGRNRFENINVSVSPLSTKYTFENDEVKGSVTFTTPLLLDKPQILSLPVSYVEYDLESKCGEKVGFNFGISPEICVNAADAKVKLGKNENTCFCGNVNQNILGFSGDNVLIDWGYLHIVDKDCKMFCFGGIGTYEAAGKSEYKPSSDNVFFGCSRKNEKGVITVAYDEVKPIEYFGQKLDEYYKKYFLSFEEMAVCADKDYGKIKALCDKFDEELTSEALKLGENYKNIATVAYRQAIAAHKLVCDNDGNLLLLSKECYSNGCIGTLDVTYPSIPLFLKYNPKLVLGMLEPIIRFAKSGSWNFEFAPHDVGQYPKANGQVYGKTEHGFDETEQMPVEESGNMLLCVAACAKYCNKGKAYFEENKALFKKWADYLLGFGYDPGNQLCTDDFAGHLNHNCNLSIKSILALYAYGNLSGEQKYCSSAKEFAKKWQTDAKDETASRLAFDKPGTWSLKYNMVWDRILGYNIFSEEAKNNEIELYKSKLNRYGVPLDSRSSQTKLDWLIWSTAITDDKDYFDKVCEAVVRMINETDDRVPMTDRYCTNSAIYYSFRNRSVVGGVFINMI